MLISKKRVRTRKNWEPGLYPVVYVSKNLREYQKEMVSKEVQSLNELRNIRLSFKYIRSALAKVTFVPAFGN